MAGLALSGLASGVDTSSIVDQLMAIERRSVSRLQLQSSRIGARESGLKDVQAKLSALKSAAAALQAPALYATKQVAESSDPRVVSAEIGAGAPIGSSSFSVSQLARSTQRGFAYAPGATDQTITLTPERTGAAAVTLSVGAGATLADVVAQVNGRSDLPVFAAAVPVAGGASQLVLSSRTAGPAAAGVNSSGFTVSSSGGLLAEEATRYKAGTGALYSIDGGATVASDTNVVEGAIPGVRITLKAVTDSPVTVTVGAPATDRAAVKAAVKGFVDAYNAVATSTRGKYTEKSVPDATTSADALKGQLFGDTGLSGVLNGLRSAAGDAFAGMGAGVDSLADLGISTGAVGAGRAATSGTLVVDERKLDAALDADLAGVRQLLAGRAAGGGQPALEGVAGRFAALVDRQVGGSGAIDQRLRSSADERKRISDATARTEDRLVAREKRLRAQFAAMESALLASQTQQAWLSGQLAGLAATSARS